MNSQCLPHGSRIYSPLPSPVGRILRYISSCIQDMVCRTGISSLQFENLQSANRMLAFPHYLTQALVYRAGFEPATAFQPLASETSVYSSSTTCTGVPGGSRTRSVRYEHQILNLARLPVPPLALVADEGLEPSRGYPQRILNPSRLPIPPISHIHLSTVDKHQLFWWPIRDLNPHVISHSRF